ncbi:TetR/AcrR family transcriptional regulator [Nonomuraea mangrovi]|uniref:TetR/AcrR family transcriptional regulator n=1 Tax=Nonomuraea mangrovi TaxID=2316207 RepID=A0ABW4T8J0_9ACTN
MQTRSIRADARRNRDLLLAAAMDVIAEEGPNASLNEIARRAGVGPGTLYRHFPARDALLAAVFEGRLARLCTRAEEMAEALPPGEALIAWLRLLIAHAMTDHGLGARMMLTTSSAEADCSATLRDVADRLLGPAQREGSVRADLDFADLVELTAGIAQAAADPVRAERLLMLTLDGLRTAAEPTAGALGAVETGTTGRVATPRQERE